jgi:2-hydroxy-4-carboxymuconate semialdehyde hemiacetal dehydrogenase
MHAPARVGSNEEQSAHAARAGVKMNICILGHGMMGIWHSETFRNAGCTLHTLVGVVPEQTSTFATQYGYRKWAVDYAAALRDPEIDAVVITTPSEFHAAQAIKALEHGKHVLVEIPIAMNLADAERVVATAEACGRVLAVCHPRRFGAERQALCRRVSSGAECVRMVECRFFIHRLSNVGATGLKRDWTDNLLWHHVAHLVDFALWISSGGRFADADRWVRNIGASMPPADPRTGTPMEAALLLNDNAQTIVCSASYYSRELIYDLLVVTDRDSYRFDEMKGMMTTGDGQIQVASQQSECRMVAEDFIAAVREAREPAVSGSSVLPAMRILEVAQEIWDLRYGRQAFPGRPLPTHVQ